MFEMAIVKSVNSVICHAELGSASKTRRLRDPETSSG
jgi:hypothetical protein